MSQDRKESRGRIFLWALIVASALALVIVVHAIWGEVGQWSGAPPVVAGGQTARQIHDLLMPWAQAWHADAGIVSCTTSVRRYDAVDEGWTCQVYSPSAQRIALTRIKGQEVLVLRETAAIFSQQTLPETAWRTNSDDALRTWWRHGGQAIWESPAGEALYLQLGPGTDSSATWQVTVSPGSGGQMAFWEISAESGKTLHIPAGRDG